MRISTEELEYWGEQFRELGLARYMRFVTFLHAPHAHLKRIFGGEYRPLLPQQSAVSARLDAMDCEKDSHHLDDAETPDDLMVALDEMTRLAGRHFPHTTGGAA